MDLSYESFAIWLKFSRGLQGFRGSGVRLGIREQSLSMVSDRPGRSELSWGLNFWCMLVLGNENYSSFQAKI